MYFLLYLDFHKTNCDHLQRQVGWTGVMSFLTTFSFPYMLNSSLGGQGCFWIYSAVSFAGHHHHHIHPGWQKKISFPRQASYSLRAPSLRQAGRQKQKSRCFSKRCFCHFCPFTIFSLCSFAKGIVIELSWIFFQKADSSTEKESPPTPILKCPNPKKLQEWTTVLRCDPKAQSDQWN